MCGLAAGVFRQCQWCGREFEAINRKQALQRKYCDRKCMLGRLYRLQSFALQVQG